MSKEPVSMSETTTLPSVTVVALSHDLSRKRSIVTLVWTDDLEKSVALPVPYGCSLDEVQAEAEKALRGLSRETANLLVMANPDAG